LQSASRNGAGGHGKSAMLRAIVGARPSENESEAPVKTPEVRRMYAFANTVDPRLIKLLKLVEQARTDLLRQGRFFQRSG
jgi:hypothetical protein